MSPPAVKAQCSKLKEFTTEFPKEYKEDYHRMRADFPVELHTTSKVISAPYQQSTSLCNRWAALYVNIGELGLDERAKNKMKVLIQGRPEEGQTKRLISEQLRGHNGKVF